MAKDKYKEVKKEGDVEKDSRNILDTKVKSPIKAKKSIAMPSMEKKVKKVSEVKETKSKLAHTSKPASNVPEKKKGAQILPKTKELSVKITVNKNLLKMAKLKSQIIKKKIDVPSKTGKGLEKSPKMLLAKEKSVSKLWKDIEKSPKMIPSKETSPSKSVKIVEKIKKKTTAKETFKLENTKPETSGIKMKKIVKKEVLEPGKASNSESKKRKIDHGAFSRSAYIKKRRKKFAEKLQSKIKEKFTLSKIQASKGNGSNVDQEMKIVSNLGKGKRKRFENVRMRPIEDIVKKN